MLDYETSKESRGNSKLSIIARISIIYRYIYRVFKVLYRDSKTSLTNLISKVFGEIIGFEDLDHVCGVDLLCQETTRVLNALSCILYCRIASKFPWPIIIEKFMNGQPWISAPFILTRDRSFMLEILLIGRGYRVASF